MDQFIGKRCWLLITTCYHVLGRTLQARIIPCGPSYYKERDEPSRNQKRDSRQGKRDLTCDQALLFVLLRKGLERSLSDKYKLLSSPSRNRSKKGLIGKASEIETLGQGRRALAVAHTCGSSSVTAQCPRLLVIYGQFSPTDTK